MRLERTSTAPSARRFGPYSPVQQAYLKEQLHRYLRQVPIRDAARTLTPAAASLNGILSAPEPPRYSRQAEDETE